MLLSGKNALRTATTSTGIKTLSMRYTDIIAQSDIQQRLRLQLREDRVAHAYLFAGAMGVGKLPTALAYASALLCKNPQEGEACGVCPACRMTHEWTHPDLHFVFPVAGSKLTSDSYITEWRSQLAESVYFSPNTWLQRIEVGNKQAIIGVAESEIILQKLSLTSQQGGYKVIIIWQPERMNEPTANKLLKILEEPSPRTVFLLVSDNPDKILETIRSRTQRIDFPPLSESDIATALMERRFLSSEDARAVAHLAEGSFTKALAQITAGGEDAPFFEQFVEVMRKGYLRDIKALQAWSETLAAWGREEQKAFLSFAQRLVRENFMYNFRRPELVYMASAEAQFAQRFARFVNERNVYGIMSELADAQRDIEQNTNSRMVFFDLALKIAVLIKA